ncbi:putative thiazole-containing bacteriocin maturation protein [Halobacillus mangrovi]|uniref:putative thiazole-containing bacteriocin maturation protein n=1 Tax=Halobacillus mangrovi TaxID=402384 RepID=UPI003D956694
MSNVRPSMRLKVKKGTFFMPEPNGSVYFRNNSGSFRMEGSTVHQWVEKLIPMLNGEHSLASLTDGLPALYRDRVYEITESLYTNGFLRDVSKDRPHELKEHVMEKFASQIEYLESFGDSAAYRFQHYRQQRILAIGEGSMLIGLVSSLLQSGMARFHTLITDSEQTSLARLEELEESARKTDPDVSIEVLVKNSQGSILWEKQVEPFDAVIYVSEEGNVEELQRIAKACKRKGVLFAPVICLDGIGCTGPFVSPDADNSWDSAWRSLPQSLLNEAQTENFSTGSSMLANVLVFELFKRVTGVKEAHHNDHMFLLNMETLEGRWHSFKPHPLITKNISIERVDHILDETKSTPEQKDPNELFYYFSELAASPLGIFQKWEEGDLTQLPLAQCEIQVADVHSEGPADPHPRLTIAGMTHQEVRREAALIGIEQYVMPLKKEILESIEHETSSPLHLGAGDTLMEATSRALKKAIQYEWKNHTQPETEHITKIIVKEIEEDHCRYYWQALSSMNNVPQLGIGKDGYGFPVMWFKTDGNQWRGCVGLSETLALREALLLALMEAQSDTAALFNHLPPSSNISFEKEASQTLDVPLCDSESRFEVIHAAKRRLEDHHKKLFPVKVLMDTFEKDSKIHICGVWLGEEEEL